VPEVYRPVVVGSAGADLPVLAPYVPRARLRAGQGCRGSGGRAEHDGSARGQVVDGQDPRLLGGGPPAAAWLAALISVRPSRTDAVLAELLWWDRRSWNTLGWCDSVATSQQLTVIQAPAASSDDQPKDYENTGLGSEPVVFDLLAQPVRPAVRLDRLT
jgi:hypothetical protein